MADPKKNRTAVAARAELDAFLAANPDIQAVQIMITDPSGVLRGKSVRREELERIFDSGRQVAGSILGLDITGQDVDDDRARLGHRRRGHDRAADCAARWCARRGSRRPRAS